MNPTTTDPDLKPLYDYRDTYDPAAPIADQINRPPDLNDSVVLVKLLKEHSQGMAMEAEAASGVGNQCGCSNPSFTYGLVSRLLAAAARKLEATIPKPAPAAEPPKTDTPTNPSEPTKTEPAKPGKK